MEITHSTPSTAEPPDQPYILWACGHRTVFARGEGPPDECPSCGNNPEIPNCGTGVIYYRR